MENNRLKCNSLRATLGWSGRAQITKKGSGQILCSPYVDRLLNDEFYPGENRAEDNLDAWPTCPECLEPLAVDEPERELVTDLPETKIDPLTGLIAFLFLVLILAAIFFLAISYPVIWLITRI